MKLAFLAKGDDWGSMPFYFNISNPVGKGYPNAPFEDVAFVQFCFAAIASNTLQDTPPNLKGPWSTVKVTGRMDQLTQDGMANQAFVKADDAGLDGQAAQGRRLQVADVADA